MSFFLSEDEYTRKKGEGESGKIKRKNFFFHSYHSSCFICTRTSDVAEGYQKLVYSALRRYCFLKGLHLASFFLFVTYIFFWK